MDHLMLEWIQERVRRREYLLSLHADEERRDDGLDMADLEEALLNGQILEEYPKDRRGPSCLVYGTFQGQPIHVICGRNQSGWMVVITVYIPSEPKWQSPTKRREQ